MFIKTTLNIARKSATLYKELMKMNQKILNLMTFAQKSFFQDAQYR